MNVVKWNTQLVSSLYPARTIALACVFVVLVGEERGLDFRSRSVRLEGREEKKREGEEEKGEEGLTGWVADVSDGKVDFGDFEEVLAILRMEGSE